MSAQLASNRETSSASFSMASSRSVSLSRSTVRISIGGAAIAPGLNQAAIAR